MKIKVKNLGILKQAEFTLGDLTIICGNNNSGKTYATYALFGFLDTWKEHVSIKIPSEAIEQLLSKGVIKIDLQQYIDNIDTIIADACTSYTKSLSKVFASPENYFNTTYFQVFLEKSNLKLIDSIKGEINAPDGNTVIISMIKSQDSTEFVVTSVSPQIANEIPASFMQDYIETIITNSILMLILPRPFIASVERTGAAIFYKELNFSRNLLLEKLLEAGREKAGDRDLREIFRSPYQEYALPVKKNVNFVRDLGNIFKKSSFISEEYPDILTSFADIIGGEYTVTREDELYYIPKQGKRIKISMDGSSSAVRSLLDIGFYLRHEARRGDLLMVDEPELNLHPENQRRVARLFARLIKVGIKIFITTHSDYIIKELNTLIMLSQDRSHLKQIAKDEGYLEEELLSADQVKVYIAEEALIKLDDKIRKVKCPTLTAAKINSEMGIEARSFDSTIDDMNRIQDAIFWGRE